MNEETIELEAEAAELDFRAAEPWFQTEMNPWNTPHFARESKFLNDKRERCLLDLKNLKDLLGKVATLPFEQRKDSFNSILRQASGAYGQLARIDDLLTAVNPAYNPDIVFHRVMQREFERNALTSPVPRYYTLEVIHAA